MAQELYQDPYERVTLDPKKERIVLEWREATATMTDGDFQASLTRLAEFSETHRARHVVIDVRGFRHKPGDSIMGWRDTQIIPRYNAAGIKKFAFLLPEAAPERPPAPEGPAAFPTGWFNTPDHLEAWLSEA